MVAESVKSYPVPYPALIPLSSSVGGIPGYSSCSTSSLLHNAYSPSAFSPALRMDHRHSPTPSRSLHEAPRSLSPAGMSVDDPNCSSTTSKSAADIFSQRKQREFIPDNKKDDSYWDRRRRNNEAAKRSREKRRFNDMVLEQRVLELSKENHLLKAQLTVISERYNIQGEGLINVDQVLSSMPQAEQILSLTRRNKMSPTLLSVPNSSASSSHNSSGDLSPSPNQYNSSQMSPNSPQYNSYSSVSRDGRQSPDYYNHRSDSMERDEDQEEMQEIPTNQEHLHQVHQYASHRYQDSEKQPTYYEQKALNLSRAQGNRQSMSSPSPSFSSHSDYSSGADVEMTHHSPISDNNNLGSCLPHKLRHKTHLGDKDAAQSLLALHGIKPEPRETFNEAAEDSASSDERDSAIGMSSSSSSTSIPERVSPNVNVGPRVPIHESLEYENNHLRSQIQHLATEVASIKYLMLANPRHIPSETDSDGSR